MLENGKRKKNPLMYVFGGIWGFGMVEQGFGIPQNQQKNEQPSFSLTVGLNTLCNQQTLIVLDKQHCKTEFLMFVHIGKSNSPILSIHCPNTALEN